MQVPVRKPGKFTHSRPDPYLTKAKFAELKKQLQKLENVSQLRAAAEVKRLSEWGDFSDNPGLSIAKGRLRGINQKISELQDYLRQAEIIQPAKDTSLIRLGSRVTVETAGEQKTYLILGSSETDPTAGVISRNSPIGSALLGHSIGETVDIKLANKTVEYKIIRIE